MPPALALQQLWPLHGRADDAGAALAVRKPDGTFAKAGSLRVPTQALLPIPQIERLLATIEQRQWERDLFVTANGCRGRSWKDSAITRLQAVWVDLDGHSVGLTEGQLLDFALAEFRAGRLPLWSAQIMSGRGVWLLFLIHDGTSVDLKPPAATPENRALQVRINRALAQRFAHMGGDIKSTNVGRLMRVPGSINTKADKPVVWNWTAGGDLGAVPAYTLEGFAREAGIDLEAPAEHPTRHPSEPRRRREAQAKPRTSEAQQRAAQLWKPRKKPRGGASTRFNSATARAAAARRYRAPLDEVLALIRHRGGLQDGHRENGLFAFGHIAASAGWTLDQVLAQVRATAIVPTLPTARVELQAHNGWKLGKEASRPMKCAKIAEFLDVKREEVEALGLELLGRSIPKPDLRLEAFARHYNAAAKPPPLRKLAALLLAEGFATASGKPLSTDTLGRLRTRAARKGMIARDVRHRSLKDHQLRLVVKNPSTPTPNPSEIVAPAPFLKAVSEQPA